MENDIWIEQFERMKRYASRVRQLIYQVTYDRSANFFVDDVHAFFVECHSFKDWLRNDKSFTEYTNREIEAFVSQNYELCLCADIANGKKHLVCDNRRIKHIPESQHLRYGIEAILTPDGDPEQQVVVSCLDEAFTVSPNTTGLDDTRDSWLEQKFNQEDINFLMYVDIKRAGKLLDYDDGIADFADDVIELWAKFIQKRRPSFDPCHRSK